MLLRVFKYFLIGLFLFILFGLFFFFNLGNILDVSQKPVKADVIVCLGGGDKYRIKKAIQLYYKNYSTKNILILTGDNRSKKQKEKNLPDKRIEYIKDNDFKNINIFEEKNTKSTKEEVIFIKKFLLKKDYKSAIIVSDAPHTRRIETLISFIKIQNDKDLKFNLVSTDTNWWDSNTYYTNKKAQVFVLYEVLKLGYIYITYGFLEKIGLLNILENNSTIETIKKIVNKETYFYLKDK